MSTASEASAARATVTGLPLSSDSRLGELFKVLLEQVAELQIERPRSEASRRVQGPWSKALRAARARRGRRPRSSASGTWAMTFLAGGGIVDGEGLAGGGEDEASVDKHAVFLGYKSWVWLLTRESMGRVAIYTSGGRVAGSAGKRGLMRFFGRARWSALRNTIASV